MKPKVLITGKVHEKSLKDLKEIAHVTIWKGNGSFFIPRQKLVLEVASYDAILNFTDVKTDKELLAKGVKLKIIANCAIGFDNLDIPLMTSHGIWATNAPGYFNYPVSEYALAGIMVICRRLLEADEFVKKGKWKSFEPGRWDGTSLKDKTVGIVGLGTTGKELRRLIKAFGAKVIYHTPSPKRERGWVTFDQLVKQSDIISIHVPLLESTHLMFDKKVFSAMKPGAVLVNISRGAIMDEEALIEALKTGKLGGAVLDVFVNDHMCHGNCSK